MSGVIDISEEEQKENLRVDNLINAILSDSKWTKEIVSSWVYDLDEEGMDHMEKVVYGLYDENSDDDYK